MDTAGQVSVMTQMGLISGKDSVHTPVCSHAQVLFMGAVGALACKQPVCGSPGSQVSGKRFLSEIPTAVGNEHVTVICHCCTHLTPVSYSLNFSALKIESSALFMLVK